MVGGGGNLIVDCILLAKGAGITCQHIFTTWQDNKNSDPGRNKESLYVEGRTKFDSSINYTTKKQEMLV